MALPDFIGAGVQRAATTWVYQCLKEHPEIFMPEVKEIHFFDENYDRGMEWYENFFKKADRYKVVGEITPNYINVPAALPRIARHLPDVRLFVILREPISRAYSAYKLLNEKFGHMSFQEACESTDYFLSLSRYADDLKRMYDLFPENQIKIFFYEDVRERPYDLLKELFSFLGVDASFRPEAAVRVYNAVIMPRFQTVAAKLKLDGLIELFKRTSLGQWTKSMLSSCQRHKQLNSRAGTRTPVASPEYLKQLKEYFRDDILEVQKITGRDLSSWLT